MDLLATMVSFRHPGFHNSNVDGQLASQIICILSWSRRTLFFFLPLQSSNFAAITDFVRGFDLACIGAKLSSVLENRPGSEYAVH